MFFSQLADLVQTDFFPEAVPWGVLQLGFEGSESKTEKERTKTAFALTF
jgi:hypothetical protein